MSTDEENISNLYQRSKTQGAPSHLDQAILSAAHEAVGDKTNKSTITKSHFSNRWRAAASIAAVLIISIILVPMVRLESPPVFSESPYESLPESQFESSSENETYQQDRQDAKHLQQIRSKERAIKFNNEAAKKISSDAVKKRSTAKKTRKHHEETKQSLTRAPAAASMEFIGSENADFSTPDKLHAVDEKEPTKTNSTYTPESITLTADEWLKKIQYLMDTGKHDTAKKELKNFKLKYPNKKIDSIITDTLGE